MAKNHSIPFQLSLPFRDESVEIPLNRGFVALIDAKFADEVQQFKWHEHRGYAKCGIGNSKKHQIIQMHRFVMELHLGRSLLRSEEIDHIHHNTLDNRIAELRLATRAENQHNRVLNRNNKSGYKGVYWYKPHKRWLASIRVNGKTKHLGYFATAEEAYEVYCIAAKKYFGEFAHF